VGRKRSSVEKVYSLLLSSNGYLVRETLVEKGRPVLNERGGRLTKDLAVWDRETAMAKVQSYSVVDLNGRSQVVPGTFATVVNANGRILEITDLVFKGFFLGLEKLPTQRETLTANDPFEAVAQESKGSIQGVTGFRTVAPDTSGINL
jgi:hypothetical protein